MLITEVDVCGVYVSPYALILLATYGFVLVLSGVLVRLGALRHAWHPALLMFSVFVSLFSMAALLSMALS